MALRNVTPRMLDEASCTFWAAVPNAEKRLVDAAFSVGVLAAGNCNTKYGGVASSGSVVEAAAFGVNVHKDMLQEKRKIKASHECLTLKLTFGGC